MEIGRALSTERGATFLSVLSPGVRTRFHAAVGALVLICFVAKCTHDLLIGAR